MTSAIRKKLYLAVLLTILFFVSSVANSVDGMSIIHLPSDPSDIAIDRETGTALVPLEEDDSIVVVDIETGAIIATVPGGSKPENVAIDSVLRLGIVSNEDDDTVSFIDIDSYQYISTLAVGRSPRGIAVDTSSHIAVVALHKDGAVAVIDLLEKIVIATVPVGREPIDVALDAELRLALVVNEKGTGNDEHDKKKKDEGDDNEDAEEYGHYTVSIIDLDSLTVSGTAQVGKKPRAIDINTISHSAVIANEKSNSVTYIDLSTLIVNDIPVCKHPIDAAINNLDNRAVVLCKKDGLFLVDLLTGSTIEGYQTQKESKAVAVDPFRNVAGIVDEKTDSLTLIQLPNPVPVIRSIMPTSIQRETSDALVTITGNGFLKQSYVSISGPISVTIIPDFIDNHTLSFRVPESITGSAGTFQISVTNPAPDGGISNPVTLDIINPTPSISSIDPIETFAGIPSINLTVYGTGFLPETSVFVNGDERGYDLMNNEKFILMLTAQDLEFGGFLTISASNPEPGGGMSDPVIFTVLNPVPVLTGINPPSVPEGSAEQIIQFYGSNFVKNSSVLFNNSFMQTTFVSSTQLNAAVPANVLQTAGTFPVQVSNPAPGGAKSNVIYMIVEPTSTVEPLPEDSFGTRYEDLIPRNVTLEAYDSERFSIITGLAKTKSLEPLAGITVSIHGNPEYGSVQTDENGRFSIPVNGGGAVTVVYKKEGFIESHRQVIVPWNDIAVVDSVRMIPEDTKSTTITFDGNPDTVITHTSTVVSDEDGTRSLTMIFTGDNRAYTADTAGHQVELPTITTRATEFETPDSMPAELPPTSAYTYCSELSVDGANNVRFEKPVVTYIDNFVGFDVGEVVPVGYYDREKAKWIAADNGVVVMLLDTDGDGTVDALDSTGDGQPDDLNGNGAYNDEVTGLADPVKFAPNTTHWRVEIGHFSPWDCNWPYGPPMDAEDPNPEGDPLPDEPLEDDDDDCTNSYVERRSRVFHEDIPIPGTGTALHYASNRVEGYKSVIRIPASGPSLPGSLKRINVKVNVAGRVLEENLPPLPNQTATFVWDGLDYLGRPATGYNKAIVTVSFVYPLIYYSSPPGYFRAFGRLGRRPQVFMARSRAASEISSPKVSVITLHREDVEDIADGWTITDHNRLADGSENNNYVYKGDGTRSLDSSSIIHTAAGNGYYGYRGSRYGIYGPNAILWSPYGGEVDDAGNYYFADSANHRIRKIDPEGYIYDVIDSTQGINTPYDVSVDSSGALYVADPYRNSIRKFNSSGNQVIVGSATYGFGGDEGPASEATIDFPSGIALDNFGNLYFADQSNHRVRKVDSDGYIYTVAGGGSPGYLGDGGPATEATVYVPLDVAVDTEGNLYILEYSRNRVRKVDTSGIITTVAGGGADSITDGIPATQSRLNRPRAIAVDRAGNLYISDWFNYRIRKVNTSGIITTIAGTGIMEFSGDGGIPSEAGIKFVNGIAVDPLGNIYLADSSDHRIRKISVSPKNFRDLGTGGHLFAHQSGQGYVFDTSGNHVETIDLISRRAVQGFSYNNEDLLTGIYDQFDNAITIRRNSSGVPEAIVSPDGIETALTIDENNHLLEIKYPDDTRYTFNYSPEGLMTDEYDPNNNHFVHIFDDNGRVTSILDTEDGYWTYSKEMTEAVRLLTNVITGELNVTNYSEFKDKTGYFTSVKTTPSGAVSSSTSTPDGLTKTQTLPCGMSQETRYGLDPYYNVKFMREFIRTTPNALISVVKRSINYTDNNSDDIPDLRVVSVLRNGKEWTYENDVLTGIKRRISPLGRTVELKYDPANLRPLKYQTRGLLPTSYSHDERGRLTGITRGTRASSIEYDSLGNIDYIITPDNIKIDYTYDSMGRLRYEERQGQISLYYDYDNNGNMTVLTNPKGIDHGFTYDGNDLRKTYSTPLSGDYQYEYDKERKLKSVLFPSGRSITNTYENGRLSSTTTPEGVISYVYDCSEKVSSITKRNETVTFTHDGPFTTTVSNQGTLNQTIGYTYNNDFRLTSMDYAGRHYGLIYDDDGYLTSAGSFVISRNAENGLPESVSDGTLVNDRQFNGYGEMDSSEYKINGNAIYGWNVTERDNSGRIIQKVEYINGSQITWDYTYDDLGQLIEVRKDNVLVEEYSYDPNGNRDVETNILRGIFEKTYEYSDEDSIISAGTDTYQFDKDGFLENKTVDSKVIMFNYSSRGELLSVTLSDGSVISYDYDSLGKRVAKRVNGNIFRKYLWADKTKLLAVYDESDHLIARFAYANMRTPVSMVYMGKTYYPAYNQIGSLRAIVDENGNISKIIDYDSYGNIIMDSNPGFEVPFGFAGGLYDHDTGLVSFGFRDYDPSIGRWVAKDPIDFASNDSNLYRYVLNDPINSVDILGLVEIGVSWDDTPTPESGFSFTYPEILDDVTINFNFKLDFKEGYTLDNLEKMKDLDNWEKAAGVCVQIPFGGKK